MHSNPPEGSLSHHPIIPLLSHDYSMIVPISHEYHDSLLSRFSSPPASVWSHGAKAWKLGFWRHKWGYPPGVGVMKCQFFKAFALKKHVYDTWPNNLGISHKAWLFSWETLASWFPRYRYEWFYKCFIWFTSLAVAKPNQLFNIFNDVPGKCRRYYGSPFVDLSLIIDKDDVFIMMGLFIDDLPIKKGGFPYKSP